MRPILRLYLALAIYFVGNAASAASLNEASSTGLTAGITAANLGVVYNRKDSASKELAHYYALKRGIPSDRVFSVDLNPNKPTVGVRDFELQRAALQQQLDAGVEALVLTWTSPYRVACMSITSAFAFGFHRDYCSQACGRTKPSPYFASDSQSPWRDFAFRPTMLLPSTPLQLGKTLVDRGIAADKLQQTVAADKGKRFPGTALLLNTADKNRNVRSYSYDQIEQQFADWLQVDIINANHVENRKDILFYFTGVKKVKGLQSLEFLPGAIADHLTSIGGKLTHNNSQMSSLRWLEAGATASYGTVVEPCNYTEKFPHPLALMENYLNGSSVIEAYWKSVLMRGQGLFIGEPLARPFVSTATADALATAP